MPEQPLWQRQRAAMQAAQEPEAPLFGFDVGGLAIHKTQPVETANVLQWAYPRETGTLTIGGIAYRLAAPGETPDLYVTWPWADWDHRVFVRVHP